MLDGLFEGRVGRLGPWGLDRDVRDQSALIEARPGRAEPARRRDVEAGAVAQLVQVLDRRLAVGALADQGSAAGVAHGRREDLSGAGGAPIQEDCQRPVERQPVGVAIVGLALPAAVLLPGDRPGL